MSLDEVIRKIMLDFTSDSEKIKLDLIYAFNGTGKTRISRTIVDKKYDELLCFNSLFQDDFIWDNENYILNVRENSWISNMINVQGLQNEIISNFQSIYNDSIEPEFNSESNQVAFNAKTEQGYDSNVKISKAEETIFIWAIFYTFLDFALSELFTIKEERSTIDFDKLKYIIIDDPVSSIDDMIILKVAISIVDLIDKYKVKTGNIKLCFLITTHHALFYNSIYNLANRNSNIKTESYILSRDKYTYSLEKKGDTTFGYHLILIDKIKTAIDNGTINKSHFNMFRILLEKTANFFGYKKYDDCIENLNNKKEVIRLVNLYSHGNLPEFEYSEITAEEKEILKNAFNDFYYKYYNRGDK